MCSIYRLILLFILTIAVSAPSFARLPASVAFYYNKIDSVRELINYQRVIVTPSLISDKQIHTLQKAGTAVFAYISIGEFSGPTLPLSLSQASPLKNGNWNSHVMDLTSSSWQHYLTQQAQQLTTRGFDGLFLDTLDSYTLLPKQTYPHNEQQLALSGILNALNKASEQPKLMFNRGFDLLDSLTFKPYAVVAESLYHSYNPVTKQYSNSTKNDALWLNTHLDRVKAKGIETIVIDYLPASDRAKQQVAAQRLIDEKHTPYVSDGMLYEFGVSTIIPTAKRILGLYNGAYTDLSSSPCHRFLAMPIEYQGYVPECIDIQAFSTDDLATHIDITRYAGVVAWLDEYSYQQVPIIEPWMSQHIGTIPFLFINALPPSAQLQTKLGVHAQGKLTGKVTQNFGKTWTKGYYPASFSRFSPPPAWQINNDINPIVTFIDEKGSESNVIFSASWGGAALTPFPIIRRADEQQTWLVDPFQLIEATLKLPLIPAADVTTESGRRIVTAHIDGDGFSAKSWVPDTPYAAELMDQYIINSSPLPITVSVIASEFTNQNLNTSVSATALKKTARQIFKRPNVEIASHTFNHPENWQPTDQTINIDLQKEIIASTHYIDTQLAPQRKKTKLILWSGDANPSEPALTMADNAPLLNVNGGMSHPINRHPTNEKNTKNNDQLAYISPAIRWYPSSVQVYAAAPNDAHYTHQWTQNHDGYAQVITAFDLLGHPRRLKPISLYHNMYSATLPASLNALKQVYQWAKTQPLTPLYLSEYAQRASSLYETGIAKTLSGEWQIVSTGVKSIRLPDTLGYPKGQAIAGWAQAEDGKYLILKQTRSVFDSKMTNTQSIRLKSANGIVLQWQQSSKIIDWTIKSHVPLEIDISGVTHCQILTGNKLNSRLISKNVIQFYSSQSGTLSGTLRCSPSP
ncbi:RNA-binding protein [Vibrio sinensis]|uniref:RNA-binding protein n=1 Tax=Vibrio sinensis TaxID=2302434 RepID=A0A3A6QX83_9VIBR|nr:endo alpha-1,4 polygalactosaminidase [Vibrio sinensis]RJX75156.1 RNA-binding protein [Vibrio sinensis]